MPPLHSQPQSQSQVRPACADPCTDTPASPIPVTSATVSLLIAMNTVYE